MATRTSLTAIKQSTYTAWALLWGGSLLGALVLRRFVNWEFQVRMGFSGFIIMELMFIVIGLRTTTDRVGIALMSAMTLLLAASTALPPDDGPIPPTRVIVLLLVNAMLFYLYVRRGMQPCWRKPRYRFQQPGTPRNET